MIVIGVDIGGTSIKGGCVDINGNILNKFSLPIVSGRDGEQTIIELANLINDHLLEYGVKKEEVVGIGVGCPGAIDSVKGMVDYSNNLDWYNVPLVKIIEDITGIKTRVTNDANAATLGEATFGAGRLFKNIIMLTLGTGVGGGIIINNKLYEGNEGKGAELGHALLVMDGEQCTCGRKGCIEAYASATALMKQGKKAAIANKDSLMWSLAFNDVDKIDGKVIFDAEKLGDKAAVQVVNNYVKYLGEAILSYCNIFRPDAVILSGGVAKQGDYLINKLDNYCKERGYGFPRTPGVKILSGVLGYDSGLIGAASLFIEK